MGEYYKWVNIDKKEYISPSDFDMGNKLFESSVDNNPLLNALCTLVLNRWKNNRVIFLGDECQIPEENKNMVLQELRKQWIEYGGIGYIEECVYERFKNVSCLFRESEAYVKKVIDELLVDRDIFNEYGLNLDRPYEGLFELKGSYCKYIINITKHMYISSDKFEKKKDSTGEEYRVNPLPFLMAYGRTADSNMGSWIGDIISFSNEKPLGIDELEKELGI